MQRQDWTWLVEKRHQVPLPSPPSEADWGWDGGRGVKEEKLRLTLTTTFRNHLTIFKEKIEKGEAFKWVSGKAVLSDFRVNSGGNAAHRYSKRTGGGGFHLYKTPDTLTQAEDGEWGLNCSQVRDKHHHMTGRGRWKQSRHQPGGVGQYCSYCMVRTTHCGKGLKPNDGWQRF